MIFLRIVMSWFPVEPGSAVDAFNGLLYTATEWLLGPIRRVLPPVQLGNVGLDLSATVVIFGIYLVRGIIC